MIRAAMVAAFLLCVVGGPVTALLWFAGGVGFGVGSAVVMIGVSGLSGIAFEVSSGVMG